MIGEIRYTLLIFDLRANMSYRTPLTDSIVREFIMLYRRNRRKRFIDWLFLVVFIVAIIVIVIVFTQI